VCVWGGVPVAAASAANGSSMRVFPQSVGRVVQHMYAALCVRDASLSQWRGNRPSSSTFQVCVPSQPARIVPGCVAVAMRWFHSPPDDTSCLAGAMLVACVSGAGSVFLKLSEVSVQFVPTLPVT
jgi:hypothetical protein